MKRSVILLFFAVVCLSCHEEKRPAFQTAEVYTVHVGEYNDGKKVPVDIFRATDKCRADLLVLPGYNFPRDDWYKKTDLLKFLKENSICAVFPEMKKAVYT